MFFFVNLLGLVVFLGIGVLASRNRKEIQWRSVASLLTLNLVLAWFLTSSRSCSLTGSTYRR